MSVTPQATILVILGITGDLAAIKILPALFNLQRKNALPENFKIVGFGRKPYTTETFGPYLESVITKRLPDADAVDIKSFLARVEYVQGTFNEQSSYNNLALELHKLEHQWNERANFVFYLSVPPDIYEPIITNIRSTSLYRDGADGVTSRILVEKPIGIDSESAHYLENLLAQSFKHEQIYRIDHYLAKEMIQNILTFRFANNLFEQSWNTAAIEKMEIRLWEQLGVEHRGIFYDGLGALRDVGQNHVLQMIALLTMEAPIDFQAQSIHAKRSEMLHKLKPLALDDMSHSTYRAQYTGYQNIEGVEASSNTETYFKVRAYIDDARWSGVPIIVEGGKRLHETRKEVVITFRHALPCLCPDQENHHRNTIIFALEPTESITINFWSKKPGLNNEQELRTMDFMLRTNTHKAHYIEEYEKLLLDAVMGDQTLFVSTSEIKAMWQFIDPIIESWKRNDVPLHSYSPDSDEAIISSTHIT